ncbi:MAG: gamma-glutamylcyclotransferase family protein [Polyangiaceae bacterium]
MPGPRVRLFLYGTLMRGEANHHLLGPRTRAVAAAVTAPRYRLVDLGEYPVLLGGGAEAVRGELYDLDEATLRRLDRFEGHPSLFRRQPVELASGAVVDAYLAGPAILLAGSVVVRGGDWRLRASGAAGVLPDVGRRTRARS